MPVVLDSPAAVRRAAMDLLARREHGRMELSRKLRSRGAPPDLIEPALEKLADEGLLSEARYLESFVRMRANAGYGPLRIREELTQRGLPREEIEQALRDSGFDWNEQLREVWLRKFGELPGDQRERARQGRFLSYRGYPLDSIGRLLRGASFD
ncbi:MAG TPA: recombination regulator RecX [Pseudomonas sp.]|uniref:recombination regulator RecX n=1 Tax=Stutzerimonas xanthomarina TaxID=271420 RepID=UPI000E89FED5|nr:recombination regulator RecX [Stutzerimonas xanthomarina]MBU0810450.1 recombination regulator RecX [Gammaproteobacteria bacterium]HAQ86452.1 recombination regulator RecX [Pseudomonas sp.]MBK3846950.1 recombination regulator RecX [Stutzerimonas xanthomarina]MBU1300294.1 recombination regulator RecX [Gammaproteobacteria bacterium]MBU1459205.1 recombination regulator RecX [Gammaproteobacteria bacterium]|tara:strand:- start:121 stop:582 length:462 start_codon:yes stop_codon:yes gene_type:complete